MNTSRKGRAGAFVALVFSTMAAACSLLLDHDDTQCSVDGDCKQYAPNAVCSQGFCKSSTTGVDATPGTDSPAGSDGPSTDGGADSVALGPPGCFRGTPTTDLEFYNACTTSEFLAFDNCARIGLCNDAGEPAPIDPPVPDAGTAPPPIDGGPTESCYDSTLRPQVIFMQGSTNFTPFIQAMAPIVAASGYTLVWQATSSCAGAGIAFDPTPGKDQMKNPTTTATAFAAFYDPVTGAATPCLLGAMSGNGTSETTDIGESDIYGDTCSPTWTTASVPGVGHYTGPIQPMVLITPPTSTQRAISAEAAREVFGLGGNAGAATPWTDPNFMFIRSSTTGTANIVALGIGANAKKLWGVDKKTAPNMRDSVIGIDPGSAEKTLGILSMDFASKAKQNLHILYFQSRGQLAGFLPDRTPFTDDRENVRDGHYPLWGPIHLYTKLNGGTPSPAAAAFINQFSVPKPDQSLLDATIGTGNVPVCAMKVTRTNEVGPLASFTPTFGCGCYFELKVNGGTNCQKCSGPAECPASRPACNIGYCEVQ